MNDSSKTLLALREELNQRHETIEDLNERIRKIDEDPNTSGVHADNNKRLKKIFQDLIFKFSRVPELICPNCNGDLCIGESNLLELKKPVNTKFE